MLTFNLNGTILEVVESTLGPNTTLKSYWYYDIINWRKSSTGKVGGSIDRDIESWQIDWIKKYYFPKVGLV